MKKPNLSINRYQPTEDERKQIIKLSAKPKINYTSPVSESRSNFKHASFFSAISLSANYRETPKGLMCIEKSILLTIDASFMASLPSNETVKYFLSG